jgi:hypothetical protein
LAQAPPSPPKNALGLRTGPASPRRTTVSPTVAAAVAGAAAEIITKPVAMPASIAEPSAEARECQDAQDGAQETRETTQQSQSAQDDQETTPEDQQADEPDDADAPTTTANPPRPPHVSILVGSPRTDPDGTFSSGDNDLSFQDAMALEWGLSSLPLVGN